MTNSDSLLYRGPPDPMSAQYIAAAISSNTVTDQRMWNSELLTHYLAHGLCRTFTDQQRARKTIDHLIRRIRGEQNYYK
jgi:hypothetical protein